MKSPRQITLYELASDGETLSFFPTKKTCREAAVELFEKTGKPMEWREHTIADTSGGVCILVNTALAMQRVKTTQFFPMGAMIE